MDAIRIQEEALSAFITEVFVKLGVEDSIAVLGARSLLDASLMGIDSHGVESLEMYVAHIKNGGLNANSRPVCLQGLQSMELWDMQHGMGLACGRMLMEHSIRKARDFGIHM